MQVKSIAKIDDLFKEWTTNRKITLSFASYVKVLMSRGVIVLDIEKYSTLLNGGNHRAKNS